MLPLILVFTLQVLALPEVPGLSYAGVGFNAVNGQALLPVINFTFTKGKVWASAWTLALYSVPDQAKVSSDPYAGVQVNTFRSEVEYSHHLARQAGIDVASEDGPFFAASSEMRFARDMMSSGNLSFTSAEDVFTLNRISLLPAAQLPVSLTFSAIVSTLPAVYDPIAYGKFVDSFGTHVVVDVTLGGKASWMVSSDSSYSSKYTDFELQGNAQVSYDSGFKLGIGTSYSREVPSFSFLSHTIRQLKLRGGDVTQENDFSQWIVGVPEQPAPVRLSLAKISLFVQNTTIALNIDRYIKSYYAQFQLGSYKATPQASVFRVERCDCQTGSSIPPGYALTGANYYYNPIFGGNIYLRPPLAFCRPCRSFVHGNKFGSIQSTYSSRATSRRRNSERAFAPRPKIATAIPIPGLDLIGGGYDVALGEYRPLSVFALSADNQNFTNPFTNQEYYYPGNVELSTFAAGTQTSEQVFNSSQAYASYLSGRFSVSNGFGSSFSVGASEEYFYASTSFLAIKDATTTLFSLTMPSESALSPEITFAIASLPVTLEFEAYAEFVARFGTHVIQSADIGGKFEMKAGIDADYVQQTDKEGLSISISTMFDGFKVGFGYSANSSTSFTHFMESSFASASFFGGDFRSEILVGNYDAWLGALWNEPIVVSPSFVPIYSLISNPSVSGNMKSFVDQYLKTHSVASSSTISTKPLISLVPNSPSDLGNGVCSSLFDSLVTNLGQVVEHDYCLLPNVSTCSSLSIAAWDMSVDHLDGFEIPFCPDNVCSLPSDEGFIQPVSGFITDAGTNNASSTGDCSGGFWTCLVLVYSDFFLRLLETRN